MTIGYNDPGWARRNPAECERGIPEFGFEELSDEVLDDLYYHTVPQDEKELVERFIEKHTVGGDPQDYAVPLVKHLIGEHRSAAMWLLADECLSMKTINAIWCAAEEMAQEDGMKRLQREYEPYHPYD